MKVETAVAEAIAPSVELMDALDGVPAVAVRQVTQITEAAAQLFTGLPFEKANKYKLSLLSSPLQPLSYKPSHTQLSQLPADIMVIEKSHAAQRFLLGLMGCQNLRPLTLSAIYTKEEPKDDEGETAPLFELSHPFNMGGLLCCPHQTITPFGSVTEDWVCGKNYCSRLCLCCFCCHTFYNFETDTPAQDYQLIVNLCCSECGYARIPNGFRTRNNFCGATCCKNDMVFYIVNKETGEVVAFLQKTYAGPGKEALGRCCFKYNNYIVGFPEKATVQEKVLILGALFGTEYVHFENTGGE